MQATDTTWSQTEKQIARTAFNNAYQRELDYLVKTVREQSSSLTEIDDVWRLHDFLSARRHEIDGKYDYRYSVLVFVLASLVREGWLQLSELEGLAADKLAKITALTRM
ncbi:hypothetical protein HJG54_04905 [Leptolyngbya sp. NK1-12]|uniref:Fluorescence recovery protein n=1 Tax=Leptolyngbya sp. NK1-12 TaxID=2547451 RepID=A0AA96WCY3_9CYAN|nr:hypothetical protein [Leptolyngbya sp. NK1-12]WNZ22265.1 hypothetical protein HJG54_04905 [Leptolyngbya sp. NK1-12]